jgi:beta-hydroxyacyl-ACP dehydratase FabZ
MGRQEDDRVFVRYCSPTQVNGMTAREIQTILPHRYPFLLVDKIVEQEGQRIVGLKNVTVNEPFFQGHFPGYPVMPGVLIIEAMAQIGGILFLGQKDDPTKYIGYLAGVDKAKFRRPVTPGDQLRFELEMLRMRTSSCKMKGQVYVGDEVVAEAEVFLISEQIA